MDALCCPYLPHIWETIRHLGAADMSLSDKTDDELLRTVEADVDERIAKYRAKNPNGSGTDLLRYVGMLVYGTADTPRDRQIETGMLYFDEERRRQRELRDAIEAIKRRGCEQPSPAKDPSS